MQRTDQAYRVFPAAAASIFIGRNGPEQNIGMAGRILCGRVDADIDAEIEWFEVKRCSPGIIHHDDSVTLVGSFDDSRNVLHFESV